MQYSGQKRREFGLVEAPTELGGGPAELGQGFLQAFDQFIEIVRSSVGQGGSGLVPHAFIRVEFGRIRREGFQSDAPATAQERADRVALVTGAIVPDHDDETP